VTQELQQNRYDQLLRRVGGMTGPGAKVAEVIPEVFPVIDLENLPAELYLLSGTRLAFGGVQQIGLAGESARIQLFNPADSGQIVTLTTANLNLSITGGIRFVVTPNVEPTNDLGIRFRDTRLGVLTRPTAEVRSSSNAAVLAGTGEFRIQANVPLYLTDPNGIVVLAPGTGITFNTVVVATTFTGTFFWRERVAEQSELNF